MHDLYEDEELISFEEQAADGWQYSLRPRRLNEYIGQDKVKSNLSKFIQAALSRGGSGSCAALWTARPWEDNTCCDYCQ